MPILNIDGADITRDLTDAANSAGIPLLLLLGCAIAESRLNPRAQRWGHSTPEAQEAIASENWPWLQSIIDAAWADVSFGYMQHIVKFHYLGDRTQSYTNCLDVRRQVFENPRGNLVNGAIRLAAYLAMARQHNLVPVGGDDLLGACVIYNRGHWPVNAAEWKAAADNIANYRAGLAKAAALLADPIPEITTEESPVTIEQFVEKHPELAIWTEDGSTGEVVDVNERLRMAGSADHVIFEFDGNCWATKIDPALFPPAP